MKPNAKKYHNPDPAYLRGLIENSTYSQREVARLIGITDRSLRLYITIEGRNKRPIPYSIQYCVEQLCSNP